MNYTIEYSDEAKRDLEDIFVYIAWTLLAPETAVRQYHRIVDMVESLDTFPFRNPLYEEEPWHSKGLRFVPVDSYLILYFPQEETKTVSIVRIMFAGRDIEQQLAGTSD